MNLINAKDYHQVICALRDFFMEQGYIEVPTQSRLSILAACEDPTTIGQFDYNGQVWPLPQTGQMWLEYELLKNPDYRGVFCQSTSYRQEANPVAGRHDLIFPMFEFEGRGTMKDLMKLEAELCEFLQLTPSPQSNVIDIVPYNDACKKYKVQFIGDKEEELLQRDHGNVVFLTEFPERTSPFWNMKRSQGVTGQVMQDVANKVDVIIHGMETIGSAERETDPDIMRSRFHSISNGMYADLLFAHFGRERVLKELEDFLALPMVPRFGGGMGITRLIRALKLKGTL